MINRTQDEIIQNWPNIWAFPMVSIRCTTYNHEQFIAQALDGFLMQETNFPFEVVVHDDASTDKTAEIIREYERKYPKIIKPIYEKENQYSKHDGSLRRIMNAACKGKYVAYCEGDDYWISPTKLQKQIDCLERNKQYFFSYTDFFTTDQDGTKIDRFDYSYLKHLSKSGFVFHNLIEKNFIMTLSFVCRRELFASNLYQMSPISLDYMTFLISASMGLGTYINEKTCCYRKVYSSATNSNHNRIINLMLQTLYYVTKEFLKGKVQFASSIYYLQVCNSIVVKGLDLFIKRISFQYLFFVLKSKPLLFFFIPSAIVKEIFLLWKFYFHKFIFSLK